MHILDIMQLVSLLVLCSSYFMWITGQDSCPVWHKCLSWLSISSLWEMPEPREINSEMTKEGKKIVSALASFSKGRPSFSPVLLLRLKINTLLRSVTKSSIFLYPTAYTCVLLLPSTCGPLHFPGVCGYSMTYITYEDLELGTTDERENVAFVFLGYFTQYNLLQVQPLTWKVHDLIVLYSSTVFNYVYMYHMSIIHSSDEELFLFPGYNEYVAMNTAGGRTRDK